MKNYFKSAYVLLKNALFDDLIDRYLLLVTFILSLASYYIWHRYLAEPDIFVYMKFGFYPVKFLAIIIAINTFLAVFAHDKDKEIGYLLFIGSLIISILILVLEIFYLANL